MTVQNCTGTVPCRMDFCHIYTASKIGGWRAGLCKTLSSWPNTEGYCSWRVALAWDRFWEPTLHKVALHPTSGSQKDDDDWFALPLSTWGEKTVKNVIGSVFCLTTTFTSCNLLSFDVFGLSYRCCVAHCRTTVVRHGTMNYLSR